MDEGNDFSCQRLVRRDARPKVEAERERDYRLYGEIGRLKRELECLKKRSGL